MASSSSTRDFPEGAVARGAAGALLGVSVLGGALFWWWRSGSKAPSSHARRTPVRARRATRVLTVCAAVRVTPAPRARARRLGPLRVSRCPHTSASRGRTCRRSATTRSCAPRAARRRRPSPCGRCARRGATCPSSGRCARSTIFSRCARRRRWPRRCVWVPMCVCERGRCVHARPAPTHAGGGATTGDAAAAAPLPNPGRRHHFLGHSHRAAGVRLSRSVAATAMRVRVTCLSHGHHRRVAAGSSCAGNGNAR